MGETQPQANAQECTSAQPKDEVDPAEGPPNECVTSVAHLLQAILTPWVL